ncbi:MAG: DUF4440 domain-containing protein [Ewingella sp.]|uniref:DUF4440 domain-containing protein n=1 Tax=Dryocola clanedunensis TaxID=2925396 RepID=UPI0022F122ED|nr:DUF4440 domain-containing protein [Dryocola clanedunensis]MCT4708439.1 DUF4440 domain-containing protein [Dryocola clanedunensis]MCT4711446.1 DUF4440 domain-containing protein [Dryocola clanedunensis]MDN5682147.1 DUF4440 domain-containing protein [Ewingella sp.]
MNRYQKEVIDAHIAIENWLSAGEGDGQALVARFSTAFSMVTTGGAKLDFPALCAFFNGQQGAKPGLKIELEEIEIVAEWPTGAVVSYSEKQSLPGGTVSMRHSTVVLNSDLLWLRLHETTA